MTKQNNRSIKTKLSHQTTDKKSLFIGGVIVFLIALTPYLFYSYKSFPKDSQFWETSLFTLETSFASINAYMWFVMGKVVPLLLLLIWFFTCKHWWHWIILVPIAMYAFQLWGIINQNDGFDELEIYYIIPLMIVLVPSVYLIRAKLFNSVRGDNLEEFEDELLSKRNIWQQVTDLFR